MIKNIIFDLGNVLISFRPSEFLDKNSYPESLKSTILSDIFRSKEWLMLDNGEITIAEAIDSISKRSSLKREEIAHIFNLRTDIFSHRFKRKTSSWLTKKRFQAILSLQFPSGYI
jgi:FMN phosphatase YigB (HAD superfamily)